MARSTPPSARGGRVKTDFPGLAAVPSSVVIQPDGKIVVAGGAFPLFTFAGDFKVVRYNSERIARYLFWERRHRDDEFSPG